MNNGKQRCPRCGHYQTTREGTQKTAHGRVRRFICWDCYSAGRTYYWFHTPLPRPVPLLTQFYKEQIKLHWEETQDDTV